MFSKKSALKPLFFLTVFFLLGPGRAQAQEGLNQGAESAEVEVDVEAASQQKIKDFYLSNFKEDGSHEWEVEGKEAVIHDEYVDIDTMKANYYAENDTIAITSDTAKLNKENMDVNLKGNVHIENKDGLKLDTESLDWQRENNFIETEERVKTSKDNMQITAKGLAADTELKKADYKEDVEVVFPDPETGDVATATCTGPLEIEYSLGTAVFNDNVVVTHTQGKLFSDKATLFFDNEGKQIKKIISEGNVKILRGSNTTYAQKATYYGPEQRLVLEGRPRIVYFPQEGDSFDFP